jgi:hypothetical protein
MEYAYGMGLIFGCLLLIYIAVMAVLITGAVIIKMILYFFGKNESEPKSMYRTVDSYFAKTKDGPLLLGQSSRKVKIKKSNT